MRDLKALIREIPDFPKPGILFKDITTLLRDAGAFDEAMRRVTDLARPLAPQQVVCVESRGFLVGAPVARDLGAGVIPIRKPGKLPGAILREEYALEYGTDALEMHEGAIAPGQRVLVVDDVLATGGTASAAARLIARAGGVLAGYVFLIELSALGGRARLGAAPAHALITY
ncbi:MAG: adenine phosphoribosyltransferase [bacterium]